MGCRPSELMGIHNDYVAWCVDEVVMLWGAYVQSELDKVGVKQKPKDKALAGQRLARLRTLLSEGPEERKFATPMATR